MNTDTHSYRDKGRALFLAAIMVSSMVAGVAVFGVAPAAATNSDVDQNADNFGSVVGFETQDDNVGSFSPGTNVIEIAYEGDITSDIDTNVNVTLLNGAGEEQENSTDDVTSAEDFGGGVGNVETEFAKLDSFSSANVNITPSEGNTNILLEINADSVGYGSNPLQDNNVSTIRLASDAGNNDLNTTDLSVTYATQTIVGFQSDETVVGGGQVAVQAQNDSSNNLSVRNSNGDGLTKTLRAVNDEFSNGFIERQTGAGSDIAVIDTGTDEFDGVSEFELQPSPQGDITVDDGNVSNISVDSLGLEVTDVDTSEVEVNDDDQIVTGEEVEVTVETALTSRDVDVEAQFNGVSLGSGAEASVSTGTNGEATATLDLTDTDADAVLDTEFDGSEPAIGDNLTVEATEQEVGATAEGDTIQLVEQEETEAVATIESGVINENVGDFAFFDIAVEDAGSATFNITEGDFDAGAEIDFDSATGGEVTLGVNTAALDDPSTSTGDFFITGDTDDEVTDVSVSDAPSGNVPAVTYRAELTAGDANDRTQLNLVDQEFNSLSTHIAPTDGDTPQDGVDAFLTEVQTPGSIVATTQDLAGEDQLALLGDAGGFYGLNGTDSSSVADDLEDEFEIDGGNISADGTVDSVGGAGHGFVFVETGTGVSDPETSSLSDVVADSDGVTLGDFNDDAEFSQGFGEGNQFLVSLNASALRDELSLGDGDSVEIRHVVDVTQYPYLDASNFDDDVITTFEESVTIENAEIEFDDVNGDDVYQVAGQDNVTISGDTNLAPGTEVTVTVSGDADFESQTVEVTENPGFEAVFDLSGFDTEQELDNIEADAPAIGGDVGNDIESEFADVPEQDIETADQEQIAALEQTIADLEDQVSSLQEERDSIAEERDSLEDELSDAESTISDLESQLSDADSTISDLQSQLSDAESTISDLESQNEDLQSQLDDANSQIDDLESQVEELQSDGGDSDGGGPGFGVAAALVALIGAALLAVRRRD